MRSSSVAAVALLLLVAAAGVFVVRELTEPARREPIAPIRLDPGAGAADRAGDGGGFEAPSAGREDTSPGGAPESPPPQIEVETPEADSGDGDEEGD